MLSGLLHPSAGEARVLEFVPWRRENAYLKRMTLLMGNRSQLVWDIPAADSFRVLQEIYRIPEQQFRDTVKELTELLELQELVHKPVRNLSLGERMKCELVAALLHRPRVLFLDEPTIGLDVQMQATLRRFVQDYNERFSATVLLTSHYMDDVAALCPRVVVIDKGRLTYDGALTELVRKVRPLKRVVVRTSDGRQEAHDVSPAELQPTIARLLQAGMADLTVEDPPLEEVMRDLFQSGGSGSGSTGNAA
jgi:ABC-2 type transport system ATP-binding protein